MLFDKIINTLFSLGAAVVIFGAWAKIESKEFASTALTVGLMTETAIFCIYGMMEWRRQSKAEETPAPPAVTGTPVHKENIEELTDSIRQTVRVLNRIFRA
jgi:hypothetical protein